MQKLRTIIVDDEPLALDLLRALLSECPDIEIVAACSNGREAVEAVVELQPELLFLDIQMPGINGFDVIRSLKTDIMPMVIFVTAFDRYALGAFDLHAVDYVLKPLDSERIARSVGSVKERLKDDLDRSFKIALVSAIDDITKRASP